MISTWTRPFIALKRRQLFIPLTSWVRPIIFSTFYQFASFDVIILLAVIPVWTFTQKLRLMGLTCPSHPGHVGKLGLQKTPWGSMLKNAMVAKRINWPVQWTDIVKYLYIIQDSLKKTNQNSCLLFVWHAYSWFIVSALVVWRQIILGQSLFGLALLLLLHFICGLIHCCHFLTMQ